MKTFNIYTLLLIVVVLLACQRKQNETPNKQYGKQRLHIVRNYQNIYDDKGLLIQCFIIDQTSSGKDLPWLVTKYENIFEYDKNGKLASTTEYDITNWERVLSSVIKYSNKYEERIRLGENGDTISIDIQYFNDDGNSIRSLNKMKAQLEEPIIENGKRVYYSKEWLEETQSTYEYDSLGDMIHSTSQEKGEQKEIKRYAYVRQVRGDTTYTETYNEGVLSSSIKSVYKGGVLLFSTMSSEKTKNTNYYNQKGNLLRNIIYDKRTGITIINTTEYDKNENPIKEETISYDKKE